jgi:hypothetical protein
MSNKFHGNNVFNNYIDNREQMIERAYECEIEKIQRLCQEKLKILHEEKKKEQLFFQAELDAFMKASVKNMEIKRRKEKNQYNFANYAYNYVLSFFLKTEDADDECENNNHNNHHNLPPPKYF